MPLNDSFYLPKYQNILENEEDLQAFLQEICPNLIPVTNQGSPFKSLLMHLLHITGPISISALELYLGPYLSQNSSRAKIGRFIKNGSVLSYPTKGIDMNSKTLYGISKEENQVLKSYATDLNEDAYIRKKGAPPMHAYGIGLSTLNLMQLGIPFTYGDQEKYSYDLGKHALIVDRRIFFKSQTPISIYLEQDMGTERPNILLQKIRAYGECINADYNDHIVFSSHAILPYNVTKSKLNLEHLKFVLSQMQYWQVDSAKKFYESHLYWLPQDILSTLECFLETHNEYQLPEYIQKYEQDPIGPYIQQQYMITKRKFLRLCKNSINDYLNCFSYIHYYEISKGYSYMLSGGTVFVIPSVMLNNYYEYFNPKDSGLLKKYDNLIKNNFTNKSTFSYSKLSDRYYIKNDSIHFRNCYRIRPDTVICIEHIGIDVGGFFRAANFLLTYDKIKEKIILICLCDSEEDAISFCRYCNNILTNCEAEIYFAYTSDLDLPFSLRRFRKKESIYELTEPIRPNNINK